MSAHLTNEEMTDRLLGVPSMTVDAHLIECHECLAELDVMRASTGNFRDAAHSWSENAVAVSRNLAAVASRGRTWRSEWIVAAAFLLLMIVPVLYLRERKSPSATSSQESPVAVSEQAQIEQDTNCSPRLTARSPRVCPHRCSRLRFRFPIVRQVLPIRQSERDLWVFQTEVYGCWLCY